MFAAAKELFEKTGVSPEKIGTMVFVTQSPAYRRPSTACVLQGRLGLPTDCACMEIALGCSGFIYGLQTALSLMSTGDSEYGLVLIGETASKLAGPDDRSIVMMYGDAGAAVLLRKGGESSVKTLLMTDGTRFRSIILPAGGFRDMYPERTSFLCKDGNYRTLYDIYMDGADVMAFTITDVKETISAFLEKTGTSPEDYDAVFLHQANGFILKQLIRRLKFPKDRVPLTVDRFGNTGGVSVPLTICDAFGGAEHTETLRALMSGFGIGLSWGVSSAVVSAGCVYPVITTADWFKEGRLVPGSY